MSVFTVAYLNLFIFLATAPGAAAVNLFGTRALSDKAREKLEHEARKVFFAERCRTG